MKEKLQRAAAHVPFHHHHDVHPMTGATRDPGDPHHPASIPPWVHLNENQDPPPFPQPAPPILLPSRDYRPQPSEHYRRGRKWDHHRDAEAPLLSEPIADHQTRWKTFMKAGPNEEELEAGMESRVMSQQWMEENIPISARQWMESDEKDPEAQDRGPIGFKGIMYRGKWLLSPERQESTVRLYWRLLLKNAFVPLIFRIVIIAFSAAGLGISATIYESANTVNNDKNSTNQCIVPASTYMGIVVGSVAIPYIGYVTWDEYMAKPLGLRSVAAKILLLLCDLYFIVFSAANVSLAFDTLLDNSWACYSTQYQEVGNQLIPIPQTCPNNRPICHKQRAFAGVLIVSLVAWLTCFSLSVLRVVEKLRPE